MEKINFLKYNVNVQTYSDRKAVSVDQGCNGFTARNIGDTPVKVNGILLNPTLVAGAAGESFSVGGNAGELYKGKIDIIFIAPAGTQPMVEITQKYYLPETLQS